MESPEAVMTKSGECVGQLMVDWDSRGTAKGLLTMGFP